MIATDKRDDLLLFCVSNMVTPRQEGTTVWGVHVFPLTNQKVKKSSEVMNTGMTNIIKTILYLGKIIIINVTAIYYGFENQKKKAVVKMKLIMECKHYDDPVMLYYIMMRDENIWIQVNFISWFIIYINYIW